MNRQVQRAKLVAPPARRDVIARPRLLECLDLALTAPLTVVSGPAGYGKTTLLREWDATRKRDAAWLLLDEGDDGLVQFVDAFVEALQQVVPGVGNAALALLAMDASMPPLQVGAALVDELLDLENDLVVILDDYHRLVAPEAHAFLEGVLRFPAPRVHLVIGSRGAPPLPLHDYRAHGMIVEIGSADLAFTRAETGEYASAILGRAGDGTTLDRLHEVSGGWAAALHLAAMAMRRGGEASLSNSSRDPDGGALEALAREEVASLPPEMRAFLLRVAIPERITAELATVLCGGYDDAAARAMLDAIEARALFLFPVASDREWFALHHRFRAFLLDQLRLDLGEAMVSELRLRAAAWFASRAMIDEAVTHALAAGDAQAAAGYVASHAQRVLAADRWPELYRWLALLPPAVVEGNIELLLARCGVHQVTGRYDLLVATAAHVERLLEDGQAGGPARQEMVQAELDVLRIMSLDPPGSREWRRDVTGRAATLLIGSDRLAESFTILLRAEYLSEVDPAAARAFAEGIVAANADRDDPFPVMRVLWARAAQFHLARDAGEIQAVGDSGHMLVATARQFGVMRLLGQGHLYAGIYHFELGELDAAAAHFQEALAIPRLGIIVRVNLAMGLARTLNAQGRCAEADALVDAHMDHLLEAEAVRLLPMLRTTKARLALTRGDVAAAAALLRRLPATYLGESDRANDYPLALQAMVALHEGDAAAAAERLEVIENELRRRSHFPLRVQGLLARAALERAQGFPEPALDHAHQAVSLAEQQGYLRVLVDLGPLGLELLRWYGSRRGGGRYLAAVLQQGVNPDPSWPTLADQAPSPASPLRDGLTERELEVLRGLERRLSNKEIADELDISSLTVKSHARRIYRKLDVSTRRQAIARATSLGLLSPSPASR